MDNNSQIMKIQSGNAMLTVYFYEKQQAETIILLHGGPGVPDEMTELREWLSTFVQVINFDQRGIGEDECSRCSFEMNDFIEDINRIASTFHLEKFHLFGHSWGGLYAQIYASKYPEKIGSLFLCSPASGTGKVWDITEREIFRYNFKRSTYGEWIKMTLWALLGKMGFERAYRLLFKQIIMNYHKGYLVDPPDEAKLARINSKAGARTRKSIKKYPLLPLFGRTPFPVIITYGDNDAYGDSKGYVYERFPYAQRIIIPDSGHTAWKHNPKAFRQVVLNFYSKILSS